MSRPAALDVSLIFAFQDFGLGRVQGLWESCFVSCAVEDFRLETFCRGCSMRA